jgi:putative heme-binding domain-containing protein
MRRLTFWFVLVATASLSPGAFGQNTNAFELRDGDRVVLVGDTLIEREQAYAFVECMLTTHFPERNVTFRNLGWSADTPVGQSRVGFDHDKPPAFWFQQLTNSIAQLKPTVVFLGYGMANSFDGEAGLPKFTADLNKLVDAIQQNAGVTQIRFVLLSPIPHEKLPPPLPDPTRHNEQLTAYTKAIKEIAAKRNAHFVDLFAALDFSRFIPPPPPITDDGIHLNSYGYRRAAEVIAMGLKWEAHVWRVGLLADGKIRQGSYGVKVIQSERKEESARLVIQTENLVDPPWEGQGKPAPLSSPPNRVQIANIKPGRYDVKVDGQLIKVAADAEIRGGVVIDRGPQFDQAEELRQAILKKNELFFHRWRPENNTYLFLFRKHEQGQNAKEIPQFDPLIEEQEKRIAELRKPRRHPIEITAATGDVPLLPTAGKRESKLPGYTPLPHPKFDLDTNLEISLYAENPLLAKPIHMNFDAQGRLWVASSEVYPQIKPGQEANDKILILEDTDGDGRAEKSTVFADGLLIPTGVEPGDGGAYVGVSTELLHFKDTDGDGRADQRRVVLSSFGTEDTHHILHTLRWGHDGQLCMNQSIYIHTHVETPHGIVRLNSGGILNLRPGTMELGITMKGLVNSWGHAIDDFGQSFATDGASSADAGLGGINYVIPQAMFFTYAGARRTLNSISPGSYPKFCGLEIVRSQHFPDDWQGNFVTCDFRAHRVVRFAIDEQGGGYVTREMPDLVRTKDVAFRPIDVKLGPDGAFYIADWSNPIIQHGEVDFRDPRRDHEHGRIWRVTYKARKTVEKPKLVNASNSELLDQLLSPNEHTARQAKRLLTERGANILSDLAAWTKKQTTEHNQLEALWMYQCIDIVEPTLLEQLLNAKGGRIRAAAVRVLAFWQERLPAKPVTLASAWQGWPPAPLPLARAEISTTRALDLLAARVTDDQPRVRIEALRALARIPNARAAELALSVLQSPSPPAGKRDGVRGHSDSPVQFGKEITATNDRFLDYALWLTINDLADPWLAALKSGAWKIEGREKQLEFGLKAIEPARASEVLGQLLSDKPLPRDGSGPWTGLIGQAGTPNELRRLFDQVLSNGFDEKGDRTALDALEQAASVRNAKPSGDLTALGTLFDHSSDNVRMAAVTLAGSWKDLGKHFSKLRAFAESKDTPAAMRLLAIEALRRIGGQGAIDSLSSVTSKETEPAIRRQAILALAAVKLDKAIPAAVEVLTSASSETNALETWRALLNIKGAALALARALPKSGIPQPVAKAGLRAAREGGRNEPELVLALTRGSGLDEGEVSLTEAELKQLAADVTKKGDPARGEEIYRRKELSCVNCHAIGGAGGKVGPDMTSLGASAPVDYLIESVWFPNKKIKEGYHALMVETKDGNEFSGVLVRETSEQLILRDATGKEIPLAKSNIADRRIGTLSLMPAGLIDGLAPAERIDLFRFLSELGKPGSFDASKGNVARLWRVRPGVHTIEQFGEEQFVASDINGKEWTPIYANVDGRLPAARITEAAVPGKYLGLIGLYAATHLQVTQPGEVKLKFSHTPDALWLDGKPLKPAAEIPAELATGPHTIVVRLDTRKLPDNLHLEASAGTFGAN